ncbi:MAG TPA: hypothetical protein VLA43_14495, partial [Longimicrobiales bacterium]|nr:hypothetical protein [Longimicrobiales bacterium]
MMERTVLRRLVRTAFHTLAGLVMAAVAAGSAAAQGPDAGRWAGDWRGVLQAGPTQLPIIFHIAAGEGALTATMDSPAQGAFAIPMDRVEVAGDTVTLILRAAQANYRGVLQADGGVAGTWTQGPASLPLDLERFDPATEPARDDVPVIPDPATRPQTPRPPFPYRVETVRFPNTAEGFDLAGTLTLPEGDGPFPAVVLVSGS